nr:hypothetical protein [Lachnospiraceae bacterium]
MDEKKKAEDAKRNGKQPPKKSAHMGRKAAGTAAILALLAGGGYFGFGVGNPDGGWFTPSEPAVTAEAPTQTPTEAPTEAPTTQEPTSETQPTTTEEGVLVITVKEHDIEYGGKIVSIEELREALKKEYKEGDRILLVNAGDAKLNEYELVETLVKELNMPLETQTP